MSSDVGLKVDDKFWQDHVKILRRGIISQSKKASKDAAEEVGRHVEAKLLEKDHPFQTKTPSAPGTAPASISGDLAASVKVRSDLRGYTAEVGVLSIYAKIQEFGGGMSGHMRWREDGVWHSSRHHSLPARPYFYPTVRKMVDDGTIRRIYHDRWAEAIRVYW